MNPTHQYHLWYEIPQIWVRTDWYLQYWMQPIHLDHWSLDLWQPALYHKPTSHWNLSQVSNTVGWQWQIPWTTSVHSSLELWSADNIVGCRDHCCNVHRLDSSSHPCDQGSDHQVWGQWNNAMIHLQLSLHHIHLSNPIPSRMLLQLHLLCQKRLHSCYQTALYRSHLNFVQWSHGPFHELQYPEQRKG